MSVPAHLQHLIHDLETRSQPQNEPLQWGIPGLDSLTNGVPRGFLTEVFGPASSGTTSVLCSLLARSSREGESCALVDVCDAFDPASAAGSGVCLERLLWVRCGRDAEKAIQCTDLLIQGGGFGLIVLDAVGIPEALLRKFPLSWWYRFRRAVEGTRAAFVILQRYGYVKGATSLAVELTGARSRWSGEHPDFRVLRGAELAAAVRKPAGRRDRAHFAAHAV